MDEHPVNGDETDQARAATEGGEAEKPLVFISHKHEDAALAAKLRAWIISITGGHVNVYASSDGSADKPRIGEDLNSELGSALWEAGLVLLLYTYEDHDWSYCAWECGVALNPTVEDTRIVFLQCLDREPKINKNRKHVIVGDEQSVIDFAKSFGDVEFYPHHGKALSGLPENILEEQGRLLHQALVDELPDDPLGNWSAWPFLRLEVPLAAISEIRALVGADERVEKGKEILENVATIKIASDSASQLFGKSGVSSDTKFGTLIESWRNRNPAAKDDWLYTMAQQVVDGAFRDIPHIREWSHFRQANGNDEHVVAVGRVKQRVACLTFDCYLCRIVDVKSVQSVMTSEQNMFYRDLDALDPSELLLKDLIGEIESNRRTRLPILQDRRAKMIVHASMIDRFVRQQVFHGADANTLTLQSLLDDPAMRAMFEGSFAFVAKDESADTAAENMQAVKGCHDVFVTETGSKDEPVVGWICDRDLIDIH